jgi:hypothetical protein
MSNRRDFISGSAAFGALMARNILVASAENVVSTAPRSVRMLILGGSGYIGPHFVQAAVARGHNVSVFIRGRIVRNCRRKSRDSPEIATAIWTPSRIAIGMRSLTWLLSRSGFAPWVRRSVSTRDTIRSSLLYRYISFQVQWMNVAPCGNTPVLWRDIPHLRYLTVQSSMARCPGNDRDPHHSY